MFWPYGWDQRLQLYGSEDTLSLDLPNLTLSVSSEKDLQGDVKGRISIPVAGDYGETFDGEIKHFVEGSTS